MEALSNENDAPTLRPGETAGMFAPRNSPQVGVPTSPWLPPSLELRRTSRRTDPHNTRRIPDASRPGFDGSADSAKLPALLLGEGRFAGAAEVEPAGYSNPLRADLNNFMRVVARASVPDAGPLADASRSKGDCYGGITGTGDVDGPALATDNALARFDGTTGKAIQNSGVDLLDDAHMRGPTAISMAEQAAAKPIAAGQGQFWVKNDTPSAPRFTDDTGADAKLMLGSNNLSDVANAATSRTNLGVGTGDSPQFAAVNFGHASDTTLARASAGDLSIEGNQIYRQGGTDVTIVDGGTGGSSAASARTNLGVGTGDSPEFAGVNVGHATDTTITRVSAGNLAVEGNAIYRAGGTDVPVADGGTGASTAAAARTNLGVPTEVVAQMTSDLVLTTSMQTTVLGGAVENSGWYAIEGLLLLTTSNTVAVRVDFDNGSCTLDSLTYSVIKNAAGTLTATAPNTSRSTDSTINAATVTNCMFWFKGYCKVGSSGAGNLFLRADRASASGTQTLLQGSWMRLTRIA